jgi:hypothetical protein
MLARPFLYYPLGAEVSMGVHPPRENRPGIFEIFRRLGGYFVALPWGEPPSALSLAGEIIIHFLRLLQPAS